jgi:hypothetical protein
MELLLQQRSLLQAVSMNPVQNVCYYLPPIVTTDGAADEVVDDLGALVGDDLGEPDETESGTSEDKPVR